MDRLKFFISKYPRLKSALKRLRSIVVGSQSVSSGYTELSVEKADIEAVRLKDAWKSTDIPGKQRELVDKQLKKFREGGYVDVFEILVMALRGLGALRPGATVLEIGCSSGFYSEVFAIANLPFRYRGCDYSESFVNLAKDSYPKGEFDIEDAVALTYSDSQFDVVISGCCLLHIPKYEIAIEEAARVASDYVIFHRTPVVEGEANRYYTKFAYGLETIEIHFSESHFLDIVRRAGLILLNTFTIDESEVDGMRSAVKTYVCRKTSSNNEK